MHGVSLVLRPPHLIWAIAVSNGPTETGCTGASSLDISGLSRGDRAKSLAEEKAEY